MKTYILLTIIILITTGCGFQKEKETVEYVKVPESNHIDTIAYKTRHFNASVTIGLLSDSSFFYKVASSGCTGGGFDNIITGTYHQFKNLVKLFPIESKRVIYEEEDLLLDEPSKIITFPYDTDSVAIKTEFYKIAIDQKRYLLSEEFKDELFSQANETNDFQELANHLKTNESIRGDCFFYKAKDSIEFNQEEIPLKWRYLFDKITSSTATDQN